MSEGGEDLVALYERFAEDLRAVRAEQRDLYERSGYSRLQRFFPYRAVRTSASRLGLDWERKRFMNPLLDDVEAEITYLRIRSLRPETVVEVSPFRGWSTTWMLRALRDNEAGELHSFDLLDDANRFVPGELTARWRLVVGDVRDRLGEMPERIGYLFIDSDHGREFAEWYLRELVPRLEEGAGASVHDIFHGRRAGRVSGEARVVLEWLAREDMDWYSPSRFGPGTLHERLLAVRVRLGLEEPIHTGDHDSMLFFRTPSPAVRNWRRVSET